VTTQVGEPGRGGHIVAEGALRAAVTQLHTTGIVVVTRLLIAERLIARSNGHPGEAQPALVAATKAAIEQLVALKRSIAALERVMDTTMAESAHETRCHQRRANGGHDRAHGP
jgi:hypothetical protein